MKCLQIPVKNAYEVCIRSQNGLSNPTEPYRAIGKFLTPTKVERELEALRAEKVDERRTVVEKELETLRAKVERHGNQANSKRAIRVLLFERWQRQSLQLLCQNFSSRFVCPCTHMHG